MISPIGPSLEGVELEDDEELGAVKSHWELSMLHNEIIDFRMKPYQNLPLQFLRTLAGTNLTIPTL